MLIITAASNSEGPLDAFVTSAPKEVVAPHEKSIYAPVEAIGAPIHDKELDQHHDIESAQSEDHGRDPNLVRPTVEERATLRKVSEKIPAVSYALCIVEFAERASYYGVRSVFSNFLQFPLPDGGNGAGAPPVGTQKTAGALDKGLQFSSAFVLLFAFLAYVTPLLGAWIADVRIGRYKTIAIGVFIAGISHIIMIIGAIPSILQAGNGLAPFVISFFILAFGTGKSSCELSLFRNRC